MPPAKKGRKKAQKKRQRSEDSHLRMSSATTRRSMMTACSTRCPAMRVKNARVKMGLDESESEEEMWNVKRYLEAEEKGKKLECQVEW